MKTVEEIAEFRAEFVRALTVDVKGRGRGAEKGESKAIFDPVFGFAIWTNTDLAMVMEKFDQALASWFGKSMLKEAKKL